MRLPLYRWHAMVNGLAEFLHSLMPYPSPLPPNERMLIEQKIADLESEASHMPGKTNILDWEVEYLDGVTLAGALKYQILLEINDFLIDKETPYILDCGANIGISVLRFKQLYPRAHITAFEPDPEICSVLRRNIQGNHLKDVTVVEAAVWDSETDLDFFSDGHDGGFILKTAGLPERSGTVTHVNTIRLADYLCEAVDFVKVDIEGAELTVLRDCADRLHNVEKMIVEVHYHVDKPGFISEIMSILERALFKVSIIVPFAEGDPRIDLRKPYAEDPSRNADLYPVIYAWR